MLGWYAIAGDTLDGLGVEFNLVPPPPPPPPPPDPGDVIKPLYIRGHGAPGTFWKGRT